ncbi:energy transducer TonB [Flavobacterium sp. EDS]|uniref:energy transducer TonB n=1 Tax=unclassified Flavobacterium TaxID=196869 RepID=UPI000F0C0592|nr:hypothetical protein EAG11_01100 [Flavobacterium sp. 140616W15]
MYYNERADIKSEFPGGAEALERFIKENYKNPKTEITGRIHIGFVIEKDRTLSDIKVLGDMDHRAEAIQVLKISPKWTPAKIKNNPVRVVYTLPIAIN